MLVCLLLKFLISMFDYIIWKFLYLKIDMFIFRIYDIVRVMVIKERRYFKNWLNELKDFYDLN